MMENINKAMLSRCSLWFITRLAFEKGKKVSQQNIKFKSKVNTQAINTRYIPEQ